MFCIINLLIISVFGKNMCGYFNDKILNWIIKLYFWNYIFYEKMLDLKMYIQCLNFF